MSEKTDQTQPLSDERQQLMELLLAEQSQQDASELTDESFELSFAQQRLWLLEQLEPMGSTFNVPYVTELEGFLDYDVLLDTFAEISWRHDNLRSYFVEQDGVAVQKVREHIDIPVVFEDLTEGAWTDVSLEEKRTHGIAFLSEQAKIPFDLSADILIRLCIVRLQPECHLLLINMHHIICDGWSLAVLKKELQAIYDAFCADLPSPLEDLPFQYVDFSSWQRQWLSEEVLTQQLDYWLDKLADLEPVLGLPTDCTRPMNQSLSGASVSFELSESLSAKLNGLGREHQATLFMTLLAGFKLLLANYSGHKDIAVGTPIANRNQPDLDGLIGFFVNTLVLRDKIDVQHSFVEWLNQVKQTCLQAYEHQDIPFEKLVDSLGLVRDLSRTPAFEVMFVLQNASGEELALHGLRQRRIDLDSWVSKFDLTLKFLETEQTLIGALEYSTALFDSASIQSMVDHYIHLLEAIVADPTQPMSKMQWISPAQKQHLLGSWAGERRAPAHGDTIISHFDYFAQHSPDRIALVCEQAQFSYGQLAKDTNQLAHYLQTKGVGPDVRVGVCIERSEQMIVAMLAILKAGGAYVPLAVDHPPQRLAYLISDSAVVLIITQHVHEPLLAQSGCPLLSIDQVNDVVAAQPSTPLSVNIHAQQLAYVMYTSGSTGLPKGVAVPHQAVVRLVSNSDAIVLDENDIVLQKAPTAFDASTLEIYGALLCGGRLVLEPPRTLSYEELANLLISQAVSTLWLTAGLFHSLVDEYPQALSRLRQLLAGGDVLSPIHVNKILALYPNLSLINGYGPTENTTFTCTHKMTELVDESKTVPIGRPITNSQVYIVDDFVQLVPVGVKGEIVTAGDGLARGYLDNAELSAEAFIPNPFSAVLGERIYKTGDLGRYLPDGSLEFLGRKDKQLKIRGFRIEPVEIEVTLMSHPQIHEALVDIYQQGNSRRLVAYVVASGLDSQVIIDYLKPRLLAHQVPAVVVCLAQFPLTSNGKIDRKALPDPVLIEDQQADYIPARNEIESILMDIWSRLLGVDKLSVNDNFFAVGGDSIISIGVVSQARRAGLHFSPKQLFEHQTIATLATVAKTTKIQAEQKQITGPVPLLPIQQWFFEQSLVHQHHYNQAVLLKVATPLHQDWLTQAVSELLKHHDMLRACYHHNEDGWQQQLNPWHQSQVQQALEVTKIGHLHGEQRDEFIAEQINLAQGSFNLSSGPLIKFVWFDDGGHNSRLLITIHHLVIDGVSWRILLEDLSEVYQSLENHSEPQLADKTSPYGVWVERLQQQASLPYWQSQLPFWHDVMTVGQQQSWLLGTVSGNNPLQKAKTVSFELSEYMTEKLLQQVPSAYRSQINDVLLAALTMAWCQTFNQQQLYLTLEGHGREDLFDDIDLSRTLGWFTSIYPLNLMGHEQIDPIAMLKSVKEQLRSIPDKGLGFSLLQYFSPSAQCLAESLMPQVSFNYLGQFDQTLTQKGLFYRSNESAGEQMYPGQQRAHVIDFSGWVSTGRLVLNCSYASDICLEDDIQRLMKHYQRSLEQLIDDCCAPHAGGLTPSDVPTVSLSQAQLDTLWQQAQDKQALCLQSVYCLSAIQRGMFYHNQLEPQSGVYIVHNQFEIQGDLDVDKLCLAWQRLFDNHDIFRTQFVDLDSAQPLQLVYRNVPVSIEQFDWSNLTQKQWQQCAEQLCDSYREQVARLDLLPLMKLGLAKVSEHQYQMLWTYHHGIMDGWSLALVLVRLLDDYHALCRQVTTQPPLTPGYQDYIEWLVTQDQTNSEQYWRQQLAGFDTPTSLGIESAQGKQAKQADFIELVVEPKVVAGLEQLAKAQRVTLNIVAQSAWGLLLSRYNGAEDVVFGVATSGRSLPLPDADLIVGLFINTVPVRIQCEHHEQIGQWLQTQYLAQLDREPHEHTPLAQVQKYSEIEAPTQLFESLFVFENYPAAKTEQHKEQVNQITMKMVDAREQNNFPLTLMVVPGKQFSLRLVFEPSRFKPNVIEGLLQHYQQILVHFAADGVVEKTLAEIEMLTETEAQQLQCWGQPPAQYPPQLTIAQWFERQKSATPDAIALVEGHHHISYAMIDAQANALALQLQQKTVCVQSRVIICMPRCIELVTAILAVVKVGGVYVPLDPDYPLERRQYIVDDCQARLMLTLTTVEDRQQLGLDCFCVDEFLPIAGQHQAPNVAHSAANGAYIIYTSGSTGAPKGVLVSNHNVCRLLRATEQQYDFDNNDIWTLFHSMSFDFSVWELWGSLLYGGRLILVPYWVSREPELFYQLLLEQNVTVLNQTPSAFKQLIVVDTEHPQAHRQQLKWVIFGGDALELSSLEPWFEKHGDTQPTLVNMYGITETTVHVTQRPLSRADLAYSDSLIGRPIDDLAVYIVDEHLRMQPVGVVGEIYVAGGGLADGYLNRADLTAERFVPSPFAVEAGQRLYRTGDLGRWLADGDIEYCGRIDHQVKIRGFRIELGEVAAALKNHPQVSDAFVMADKDRLNNDRLLAYAIGINDVQVAQLRQYMADVLPAHMVPAMFILIEKLPLTANGKIDRRALPRPESQMDFERGYVAPRTPNEQILAEIWAQLLGLPQVGVHDNFFELGGDSIVSIVLVAKARKAGIGISPKLLFENPTISQLVLVADTAVNIIAEQGILSGEVSLLPIQQWFFEQNHTAAAHFNQAMSFTAEVDIDTQLLAKALAELICHHDMLRVSYHHQGLSSQPIGRIADFDQQQAMDCFQSYDLTSVAPQDRESTIVELANQAQRSFDLSQGPLIAMRWFEWQKGRGQLLICIHHLAVDGVSWRILIEDLNLLYSQLQQGKSAQLPDKTSAYGAWVDALEHYRQHTPMDDIRDYWQQVVSQSNVLLKTDLACDDNYQEHVAKVTLSLSQSQTEALLQQVPSCYRTQINDVLLCALVSVMTQFCQSDGLSITMEGHGREALFDHLDVSRTVGWFTTLYPLHLSWRNLSTSQLNDVGQRLKSIKEQLRSVPNKGIDFGLLKYAQTQSPLATTAMPQVSFNYLGQFDSSFNADALFSRGLYPNGDEVDGSQKRAHLLDFSGLVSKGQLQLSCSYSEKQFLPTTIEKLVAGIVEQLLEIIEHCQKPESGGLTPHDLPDVDCSQAQLDELLERVEGVEVNNVELIYPLSALQLGMLHHSMLAPNSGVYMVQTALQIDGPLQTDLLRQAWKNVVLRHGVFRSRFIDLHQPNPLQLVLKHVPLDFTEHDWSDDVELCSNEQLETNFEQLLLADRKQGFDFDANSLMRLNLVRLSDNVSRLIWTQHHALSDGWSMPLVFGDLLTQYYELYHGHVAQVRVERSYDQYVHWLKAQDQAQAISYWKQYLDGFTTPTPLGIDKKIANQSLETQLPQHCQLMLSETLTARLQSLVQNQQLTLNIVAQGAWALLLSHYAQHSDVVFGAVVSGRPAGLADVESIVGPFINTNPVRVQLSAQSKLLPWLSQLHHNQIAASAYEYTPLIDIQRHSEVANDVALFDSLFVFENYPTAVAERANALEGEGRLQLKFLRSVEQTNYPLTLMIVPGQQLKIQITYQPERLDESIMQRLLLHYQQLLESMSLGGDVRLGELQWLSTQEQQTLAHVWPVVQKDYQRNSRIEQLFSQQCQLRPDAVAVCAGASQLTYSELNNRATKLAMYLAAQGVGVETMVGIYLPRSIEMIITVMAIVKTGGVYVPLMTDLPAQRVSDIVDDCAMHCLITEQHLLTQLDEAQLPSDLHLLAVDRDWSLVENAPMFDLPRGLSNEHLACIMYTSGSTGRPKGVCVTHRAIVRLVDEQNYLQVVPSQRLLQNAPLAFDAATFEIYGALLNGAALVINPPGPLDLAQLAGTISLQHVTTMWLTAGLFHSLLDEQPAAFSKLQQLLAGGDVLSPTHINRLFEVASHIEVINGYGPTENTTFSCCHQMLHGIDEKQSVPIGRPIANSSAYILDAQLKPVAVGVTGYLYCGGDGLARGYLNQPQLTAAAFVPHPFSEKAGERLYNTGDLARYGDNGVIEFCGRIDGQMKVRGFRVEAAEIEEVLMSHPDIREATLKLVLDHQNHPRLVAFLVAIEVPEDESLRDFIRPLLPVHMHPSAYVYLEQMPLTRNGKVDRNALVVPFEVVQERHGYVGARTNSEKQLVQVWQEVLGLEQVGIFDNFFDIGGDSLLAARVNVRASNVFDVELAVRDIFESPTIEQYGVVVDTYLERKALEALLLDDDDNDDDETEEFVL